MFCCLRHFFFWVQALLSTLTHSKCIGSLCESPNTHQHCRPALWYWWVMTCPLKTPETWLFAYRPINEACNSAFVHMNTPPPRLRSLHKPSRSALGQRLCFIALAIVHDKQYLLIHSKVIGLPFPSCEYVSETCSICILSHLSGTQHSDKPISFNYKSTHNVDFVPQPAPVFYCLWEQFKIVLFEVSLNSLSYTYVYTLRLAENI